MMRRWYRSVTSPINRGARRSFCLGFLCLGALLAPVGGPPRRARAQSAEPLVVQRIAEFARAHPTASGPVTFVRHVRAHARTTTEHGTLRFGREGLLVRLGAPTRTEMTIRADSIEAFDGDVTPPLLLVARGETLLARYASVLAGEDPSTLFRERHLETRAGRVRVELVPSTAWLGVERLVVDVLDEGPERGRVQRCLWLDGIGNWQRFDLEALRYSSTALDPATLALSPHPGARRCEL